MEVKEKLKMLYEEMRYKKSGEVVRVYAINAEDNTAVIFSASKYIAANNGWDNVKLSRLVPLDFPLDNSNYISKTMQNKAKSRMKLIEATWETSDGRHWNHSDIDKAIRHEILLMGMEKSKDEESGI